MYTSILHPTDLCEQHFELAKKALAIAKKFKAKFYLLHVIEPPASLQLAQSLGFAEFDQPPKEDALAVMKTLGEALKVPVKHQFVEVGSIKMHVLKKVTALKCDLIIIGSHTPSKLPEFLGSTAHAVVHRAQCDVLTVRS